MIINSQNLRGIYVAFNTLFAQAFEGQKPTYEKIATVVPSTTESETYAWLGDIPGMREWNPEYQRLRLYHQEQGLRADGGR